MKSKFSRVALIGKYQTAAPGTLAEESRKVLEDIAAFLSQQGCEVVLEKDTATNTGIRAFDVLDVDAIGEGCDLGLVVGGDGTMLGIGRQLARHGVPLIGINQGRLGFITDIALQTYVKRWCPCCREPMRKTTAA